MVVGSAPSVEDTMSSIEVGKFRAVRDGSTWSITDTSNGNVLVAKLTTSTAAAVLWLAPQLSLDNAESFTAIGVTPSTRDECPVCGRRRDPEAAGTSRCGRCRAAEGAWFLAGGAS